MTHKNTIRATFDDTTITIYQAYNHAIATAAIASQTFTDLPFKKDRMTWIKPSFLWAMYRSGWATKESQEHILAIKIKRTGFHWALQNACLSHYDRAAYPSKQDWQNKLSTSPVRIQWDPERDLWMQPLPYRAIQMGISGIAADHYIDDWITQIEDITEQSKHIRALIKKDEIAAATALLPRELIYPY